MVPIVFVMACIFFASTSSAPNQYSSISIPASCKGKMFCEEKPENYPDNYLEEIVNKKFMEPSIKPSNSFFNDYYPEENCLKSVKSIRPFLINWNNTTEFVVQTKFFEQYIEEVKCSSPRAACFKSLKVEASCVVTEGDIKIYLFNPQSGDIEHRTVKINMCCSCVIEGTNPIRL